jgi:hypothetical protein
MWVGKVTRFVPGSVEFGVIAKRLGEEGVFELTAAVMCSVFSDRLIVGRLREWGVLLWSLEIE